MNCPKCQKPLPSGAKNCPACGAALSVPDFFTNLDKTKKIGIVIGILFLLMLLWSMTRNDDINLDDYHQGTDLSNVQQDWYTYTDPNGTFAAAFPYAPTPTTSTIPVEGTDATVTIQSLSSSMTNETVYSLNITQYPSNLDLSNPREVLQNSLNGFTQNSGQQLVSSSFGTFSGNTSLDFLIRNENVVPGTPVYFQGKFIFVGNTLYQLMTVYEADNANEADYNTFINSFTITK